MGLLDMFLSPWERISGPNGTGWNQVEQFPREVKSLREAAA